MSAIDCTRCPDWAGPHIIALLEHWDAAHGGRPPVRAYQLVPEPAPVVPPTELTLRKNRKCSSCEEWRYVRRDGSCWCWECMAWVEAAA